MQNVKGISVNAMQRYEIVPAAKEQLVKMISVVARIDQGHGCCSVSFEKNLPKKTQLSM